MPEITLTTFNTENLMMRFAFNRTNIPDLRDKLTSVSDEDAAEAVDQAFDVLSEDDRTLTAQTLAQSKADFCALQEIENLVTLTAFHNRYLKRWSRKGYGRKVLIEGNDQRGIDVAALSRLPVTQVKSHAHLTLDDLDLTLLPGQSPRDRAFRRDCLEIDLRVGQSTLALFICHFKSMHGGRFETRPIREQESLGVRRLIERRFDDPAAADWIVLGDLNDFLEQDGRPADDHGLAPLIDGNFSIDALMASDTAPHDRWTHHYPKDDTYSALDHILLSPTVFAKNQRPDLSITRIGLPWRTERYEGFRLPGVAWTNPKASDHCPLTIRLAI